MKQSSLFEDLKGVPTSEGAYGRPGGVARPPDPPPPPPAPASGLPSIDAANVESVLARLSAEPSLRSSRRLRFAVMAMAGAVARYRGPSGGALAAAGLELAIADILNAEAWGEEGGIP